MNKLIITTSAAMLFILQNADAQSLTQNTTSLAQKLNSLTKKEKDADHSFSFKGCQMNMDVKTKDDDVKFDMRLSWQLKDVQKVSYLKTKDGYYDFNLKVPADRIKMKMGFGDDNSIGGSFNISSDDKKDSDSKTSFDLKTKDESEVKDLTQRFEEVIKTCKSVK
jgi:hypothetical protein